MRQCTFKRLFVKKKRAISDVISTLLLLAVTVSGAATLTYFVNENFLNGTFETAAAQNDHVQFLSLRAFDSRDSSNLLKIQSIDNKFDQLLCGQSCNASLDNIPENNGSDFIVLQIRNDGVNSVFLETIRFNNFDHNWDSQTSGKILDASQNDLTGKYPLGGKFSMISIRDIDTLKQKINNEIESGEEVLLITKLGSENDLLLNKSLRVFLNTGDSQLTDFIIETGDAK